MWNLQEMKDKSQSKLLRCQLFYILLHRDKQTYCETKNKHKHSDTFNSVGADPDSSVTPVKRSRPEESKKVKQLKGNVVTTDTATDLSPYPSFQFGRNLCREVMHVHHNASTWKHTHTNRHEYTHKRAWRQVAGDQHGNLESKLEQMCSQVCWCSCVLCPGKGTMLLLIHSIKFFPLCIKSKTLCF